MRFTYARYTLEMPMTETGDQFELIEDVVPEGELTLDGEKYHLWNCRCPGSPTSCLAWVKDSDIQGDPWPTPISPP